MESDFRVSDVPLATLASFLQALAAHPDQDMQTVSSFAGFSASTGRKALATLESFQLAERDENGRYRPLSSDVSRGSSTDATLRIIRQALQSYRPFEALCEGLALGESLADAVRKASLLLGLNGTAKTKFGTLTKWGREFGILEGEGDQVRLAQEVTPGQIHEIGALTAENLESEAKARIFNAKWLGRVANNRIDEIDRHLLADALLSYETDPRGSVESSGQALEDFLRELANSRGFNSEAKKANGAGQLASLLVGKGTIHTHHQKLCDAVGTVRNARSHQKDKRTMAPWTITPEGALTALTTTLTAIRSIVEYTEKGSQSI